ncbi:hypothetical protein F0L46_18820 [Salinarimonas soli]|uniref:Uncharacterized protein n=1 Tax=Salinarimonas soli TaxID=1638099 RepID=A0A5B2VA02_9HYPH|nr:hypothetical protein [Salinarimonas soli]KAA2235558.1 hypothetical protein F0L46_18820 [Salinarimonas soli]
MVENDSELRERATAVALDVLVNYPASALEDWVITIQDEDGRQHGAISFDELLNVACGSGDALAAMRSEVLSYASAGCVQGST